MFSDKKAPAYARQAAAIVVPEKVAYPTKTVGGNACWSAVDLIRSWRWGSVEPMRDACEEGFLSFIDIDRVLSLVRDRRTVATRQLTISEDIFQQHFPGNPMLPASLQIEAFAQAATILLETSADFRFSHWHVAKPRPQGTQR